MSGARARYDAGARVCPRHRHAIIAAYSAGFDAGHGAAGGGLANWKALAGDPGRTGRATW